MRMCRDFISRGTWKLPAGPSRPAGAGRGPVRCNARGAGTLCERDQCRCARCPTHAHAKIRKYAFAKVNKHFVQFPYEVTIPLVL